MENKFTPEQIEKAKECKSVEEIIALAKENGTDLTEAEAKNIFAKLNPANGALSDSELETVAGGCEDSDEALSKASQNLNEKYRTCPRCGKTDCILEKTMGTKLIFKCTNCNMYFNVDTSIVFAL